MYFQCLGLFPCLYFQIVKKLAGYSAGTALWATNVGNEFGQVLISVLTAGEGHGLRHMTAGLVDRYKHWSLIHHVVCGRDC